jgi:hypothetical protein
MSDTPHTETGEPVPVGPDDPALVAARVRAVLAYAAISYEEASRRSRIGQSTLRRITSVTRPRGASLPELQQLAVACRVPLRWLVRPWDVDDTTDDVPSLGAGSTSDRLRAVEYYLTALLMLEGNRGLPLPAVDVETARAHEGARRAPAGG